MVSTIRTVLLVEEITQHSMLSYIPASTIQAHCLHSDATYPDTASGGYKSRDCGKFGSYAVISTSYGYNEADLTPAYEQRQCNE